MKLGWIVTGRDGALVQKSVVRGNQNLGDGPFLAASGAYGDALGVLASAQGRSQVTY